MTKSMGLMVASLLATLLAGCTKVGGLSMADVTHEWGDTNQWLASVPEEGEWQLAIVANDGKQTYSAYTSTDGHRHLAGFARRDLQERIIRFAWFRIEYFETGDTNEEGETLLDTKWFLVGEGSVPDPFPEHGELYEAVNGAVVDGTVLMAFREHENPDNPMAKLGLALTLQLIKR